MTYSSSRFSKAVVLAETVDCTVCRFYSRLYSEVCLSVALYLDILHQCNQVSHLLCVLDALAIIHSSRVVLCACPWSFLQTRAQLCLRTCNRYIQSVCTRSRLNISEPLLSMWHNECSVFAWRTSLLSVLGIHYFQLILPLLIIHLRPNVDVEIIHGLLFSWTEYECTENFSTVYIWCL